MMGEGWWYLICTWCFFFLSQKCVHQSTGTVCRQHPSRRDWITKKRKRVRRMGWVEGAAGSIHMVIGAAGSRDMRRSFGPDSLFEPEMRAAATGVPRGMRLARLWVVGLFAQIHARLPACMVSEIPNVNLEGLALHTMSVAPAKRPQYAPTPTLLICLHP